jgi:hypothetical protein
MWFCFLISVCSIYFELWWYGWNTTRVVRLTSQGFNDKGESIPFQGGTNEQVVDRLYKKLGPEGKAQFLKVYW